MRSWVWKKLLKYRDVAKPLHEIEVNTWSSPYFWFDDWSQMGRLIDITRPRGVIDMGIPLQATVGTAHRTYRGRTHRFEVLNNIAAEITEISAKGSG